eukprot:TRINITY_DN2784_c0_g1_i2.p1 TRINITY_DN2784_c0_g1~~TRINITY_DN2784_c0_g1_i2.p1  ORF type:complete len:909 (+),score=364.41 TRINITY_DN2784_c0_g1_i2:325-3051(+)
MIKSDEDILSCKGFVNAEPPSVHLYKFAGFTKINGKDISLDEKNLLLRGAALRNTEYVIGIVLYTGKITKLSLNQKLPPSKFSTVERRLNKSVILIFCFNMCCVTVLTIGSAIFNSGEADDAYYLQIDTNWIFQAVRDFFSYFALLSFMIPMSLMVTLEVVKVMQGRFMEWDKEMATDPNNVANTGMNVKTTNLNDELALVKYVFSDKTGTLTENVMEFQKTSIDGVCYDRAGEGELEEEARAGNVSVHDFLLNLAICHAAQPEVGDDGEISYQAQSPDEVALCDGAKVNGFVFLQRIGETKVVIKILDEEIEFEVLRLIEFTSDRKRMSVIVRMPDSMGGGIRLFCKGADSMMMKLLDDDEENNDPELKQTTLDDIENFSKEGLRTLVFAYKDLDEDEYQEWENDYGDAGKVVDPNKREKLKAKAEKKLEKGFTLQGSTAIEDKLQPEVPETIHNLLRAGVKVWVITGDKRETAINIGFSCKLLSPSMELLQIKATSCEECGESLQSMVDSFVGIEAQKARGDQQLGLVVDGQSLTWALNEHQKNFLKITELCHSVVCCRVTPLQKANVVKLLKEHTGQVCLSIGDGANDVSMIQEAHIGVGIYGREGTQAARSADYAIRQFRHLRRLMTIHGRYSFLRNANLIQYSIYKNAAAFLVQFWFAFYCGYSATTIYDDWIITLFNIAFTSTPPLFYAIFEKDIDPETIDQYPEVYRRVSTGYLFTYSSLFVWLLNAVWHSIVFIFVGVFLQANEPFYFNGKTTGLRVMGNIVATMAIVTVILRIAIETNHWNILVHCGIWGSISCYFLVLFVESFIPAFFPRQYFMFIIVFQNPTFWFTFVIVLVICLVPDIVVKHFHREFYPEDWMILQEAKKFKGADYVEEELGKRIKEMETQGENVDDNEIELEDRA